MSQSKFNLHAVFNLTLICALLGSMSGSCQAAGRETNSENNGKAVEWTLTQTVRDAGTHTVKIAHDAVRIESRDQGFVVICKAPDWHVDCFRPKEKRWWRGDMTNFSGVLLINPFATPLFNILKMEKLPRKVDYAGVHCTQYIPKDHPNYVEIAADEIETSNKVTEILCRYFVVAKIGQVPVMRRYFTKAPGQNLNKVESFVDFKTFAQDLRARPQITLSTSSITKGQFIASDFEVPSGLTKVTEIAQVGFSDEHKSGFSDLMEEFGNTSGIDKKNTGDKNNGLK